MTFDEAIETLANSKNSRVETKGNSSYGVYYAPDVVQVIHQLHEEYAPTVEMTKSQLDEIARFKSMFPTRALADIIYNGQDGEWTYLDELSGHLWGHSQQGATNKNIEDTMKAYLYPALVKVVDD